HAVALEAVEVRLRLHVLVLEPHRRQVPRAHNDVRLHVVDLVDRPLHQARDEVRLAAVDVRDVGDPHDRKCYAFSQLASAAASGPTATFEQVGAEPARSVRTPRFANDAERECARLLDFYGVRWEYEPHTFALEEAEDGRVTEAFTPDFYLPEQDLYVEVTVMKQALVTRKNRKLRKLRERYPEVRIKLFYRRDIERLAQKFRLDLAR